MPDLQEIISRGRFIMANAPARLRVFESVDGRRSTADLAKLLKRHINSVRRDLRTLEDAGLIRPRISQGVEAKVDGFPVYEKLPLARTIPSRYFMQPTPTVRGSTKPRRRYPSPSSTRARPAPIKVPSEQEILTLANNGEDQTTEYKAQGTEARKIVREIAAMLNTKEGGLVLYGIDDDGNIEGSDITRQKLDQPLQNSLRNSVSPSATIRLHSVSVLGSTILVIVVPPWNRKDVYQFDEKVLIRKGTNAFAAKPEELRKLHSGQYVI